MENYTNLQVSTKKNLKLLFNNDIFKKIISQFKKQQPKVFNYLKGLGSEFLELLDIKPSSILPEPQPQAAIHQEPEPKPEELTVSEQIEAKREETKNRLEMMSIEEKEKERKKQDQRRKYGRGKKNK
ncbi:hypothetical protein MCT05_17625 [Vibrio aestuarianus]|nr:hypothetical protein [Vibrio aestuarianus]